MINGNEVLFELNGVNRLENNLIEKFNKYYTDNAVTMIGECFTWEEFYVIFCQTTFQHMLSYSNILFGITNFGDHCEFFIEEDEKGEATNLQFGTPQELLANAKIKGKNLEEIWENIFIGGT